MSSSLQSPKGLSHFFVNKLLSFPRALSLGHDKWSWFLPGKGREWVWCCLLLLTLLFICGLPFIFKTLTVFGGGGGVGGKKNGPPCQGWLHDTVTCGAVTPLTICCGHIGILLTDGTRNPMFSFCAGTPIYCIVGSDTTFSLFLVEIREVKYCSWKMREEIGRWLVVYTDVPSMTKDKLQFLTV